MELPPAVTRRTVAFRGERTGDAPLTWGQRQAWNDIQWMLPDTAFFDISLAAPMPEAAGLDQLTVQLGELVSRHESLRTLFRTDPAGEPTQHVLAVGEVTVDVLPDGADVPDEVFDDLVANWSRLGFDTAAEIPVRFLVRHAATGVSTVVICTSHLAADHASQRMLIDELSAMVAAAMAGRPAPAQRPAREPIDQAALEASPAGERLRTRAVEHWRRQLAAAPAGLLARGGAGTGQAPRYWRGELVSRAVPLALRVLAARHRSGPSSVLLAAVAALLARSAGADRCALRLVVDNREMPDTRFLISTPSQEVLAVLPVDQDSFGALVRACWAASVAAHRHGRCDPRRIDEAIEEVAKARGEELDLSYFFNDTWSAFQPAVPAAAPDGTAIRAVTAQSRFHWAERYDRDNVTFFFATFDTAESTELIKLSLLVDTRTVEPAAAEEFLRRVEALLVDLAVDGVDLTPAQVLPVAGLAAGTAGAGHPATTGAAS